MQQIVDFLRDNWQYISAGLVVLLEIVLIIFKKRPLSLDEFQAGLDDITRNLPYLIVYAEKNVPKDQRNHYVIEEALVRLSCKLWRPLTDKEREKAVSIFSYQVEQILGTPTKKGGCGREEA